jgi:3-methyl-2-oxobutanoate hydroxymethyltransferase
MPHRENRRKENMTTTPWTATRIRATKNQRKLACLTASDFATARRMDAAGIPLILVGDSLAMTVLGYPNTLPVTMDQMVHHTAAVVRGVRQALVVADMPFLSYQVSISQALENAGRFLKEAGAGAVKIEGGALRVPVIEALIQNGIPVLGHIGVVPQNIQVAGYRVRGRGEEETEQLLADARALEAAGVFALVVECVPPEVGKEITRTVGMPTIGIGAGPGCDGQVLVTPDLLGLFDDFTPKFVKRYAELGKAMDQAFTAFRDDVEGSRFPGPEHCYGGGEEKKK